MDNTKRSQKFRKIHRYVGNFLAGIMAVYAISGIVLIFRDTDFLKSDKQIEVELKPQIKKENLAKQLRLRTLNNVSETSETISFDKGTYNKTTGLATITVKRLPIVLEKLTHLHKAKSSDPLYWFNISFGVLLLLMVITSFWMFRPKTKIFNNGLYFTMAGVA
ncbi:MAG: hypothetical protein AB8B80_03375, partial [Marinicellaceae bacterium]